MKRFLLYCEVENVSALPVKTTDSNHSSREVMRFLDVNGNRIVEQTLPIARCVPERSTGHYMVYRIYMPQANFARKLQTAIDYRRS